MDSQTAPPVQRPGLSPQLSLVIAYNLIFVVVCCSIGMFFWFRAEIESIKKARADDSATYQALTVSLGEMLEMQKIQKAEIQDLNTRLVAVAVAADNLDKSRIQATTQAMVALYNDFDKRTKAFVEWATNTERATANNVNIFNKNVEIYNKRLAAIDVNIANVNIELEKHRKALLLILRP